MRRAVIFSDKHITYLVDLLNKEEYIWKRNNVKVDPRLYEIRDILLKLVKEEKK